MNRSAAIGVAAVWLLLPLWSQISGSPRERDRGALVDAVYQTWVRSVEHLASPAEMERLQSVTDALEQERAIHSFWDRRAPWVMHRWRSNFEDAVAVHADPRDQRSQAIQIAGRPDKVRRLEQCGAVIRELELWTYSSWQQRFQSGSPARAGLSADGGFSVLFFRTGRDPVFQWWSRDQGIDALTLSGPNRDEPWNARRMIEFGESRGCFRARRFGADELDSALGRDQTIDLLHRWRKSRSHSLESDRSEGAAESTPVTLVGTTEVTALGEHQGRTVVRGVIELPSKVVERNAGADFWDRLVLSADVWRGNRLVQSFSSIFYLSGTPPGETFELDFYRLLRPGSYRLVMRVADRYDRAHVRVERQLEVASMTGQSVHSPAFFSAGWTEASRDQVGRFLSFPTLELIAPAGSIGPGPLEIRAITVGTPIAGVEFLLDDRLLGKDTDPPFEIDLELLAGRPQVLSARALSIDGRTLATERLALDPRPLDFAVDLEVVGDRASVRVDVPPSIELRSADLYLDQTLLASHSRKSFEVEVPPASTLEPKVRLLRVQATSSTGEQVEDVVVLDPGHPSEEIDVRLVELMVTVLDQQGRLVTDLEKDELEVYEEGVLRPVLEFEPVATRPINVALLLDSSGSMRGRIRLASKSAERFISSVLESDDRAALLEFNHDIRIRAPFGSEVEHLQYAASGLRAAGTTRLNDSIVFTLHGFGGLDQRRALVLLSDGGDVDSDLPFAAALEAALRSRVVVFPIALELEDDETSDHLIELARTTGGSFFSIRQTGELAGVFARIEEELRSQYYVVFESPGNAAAGVRGSFRSLRVQVPSRKRLEVRTIHGYYR